MLPQPAELNAAERRGLSAYQRAALFYFWDLAEESNLRVNDKVPNEGKLKLPADLPNLTYEEHYYDPAENKTPPNFIFEGLRIWWKEGPRVDPRTDIVWNHPQWEDWLTKVLAKLEEYEAGRLRRMMLGSDILVKSS